MTHPDPATAAAETKLLPCPFCNSAADTLNAIRGWQAFCTGCEVNGVWKPTQADTAAAWNTRPLEVSLLARAEAAEREVIQLNGMLRLTGYGQGQIDAFAAQCEEVDILRTSLASCRSALEPFVRVLEHLKRDYPTDWRVRPARRLEVTDLLRAAAALASLSPQEGGEKKT